jgi:molecular chaperone DnaK (HSP70)
VSYPYCYHPIIRRNTPLPVTRTESYYTSFPNQTDVDIQIFQGDNEDALQNILVGDFRVDKLTPTVEPNEVLCRMSLDLDGILHVTASEKLTGKSKHVTIANALQTKNEGEIAAARKRIEDLYTAREPFDVDYEAEEPEDELEESDEPLVMTAEPEPAEDQKVNGKAVSLDSAWAEKRREAVDLIQRARRLLDSMHADDQAEATALTDAIESAVSRHDQKALNEAVNSLGELLFFVEGS